jgi:hypothetical protein
VHGVAEGFYGPLDLGRGVALAGSQFVSSGAGATLTWRLRNQLIAVRK